MAPEERDPFAPLKAELHRRLETHGWKRTFPWPKYCPSLPGGPREKQMLAYDGWRLAALWLGRIPARTEAERAFLRACEAQSSGLLDTVAVPGFRTLGRLWIRFLRRWHYDHVEVEPRQHFERRQAWYSDEAYARGIHFPRRP